MQWNLIRLRKEAGLTQEKMAELIGISVSSYGPKENGKTKFDSDEMFIIRHIFKKPMEEIFLPTNCNIIAMSEKHNKMEV